MTEEEALASGATAVATKLESLFKRWYDEADDDQVWAEAAEKEWSFAEFLAAGLVTEVPEVFTPHERARIRQALRSIALNSPDLRLNLSLGEIDAICPKESSDG